MRPTTRRLLIALAAVVVVAAGSIGFIEHASPSRPPPSRVKALPSADTPADVRILFVGNSLTFVGNLDAVVRDLAESSVPSWKHVLTFCVATGGARFADHVRALDDASSPLHQALERHWDLVVMQDQSQIMGFDRQSSETDATFAAAKTLDARFVATGAKVGLFETWGFWSGDASNAGLYPSFEPMARRIEHGYETLRRELVVNGSPPILLPVGRAYRVLFEDERAAGRDPLATTSLFRRLFVDDRHPTKEAAYLAAAVIVGGLSGARVSGASYVTAGIAPSDAARLRKLADEVVHDGRRPTRER